MKNQGKLFKFSLSLLVVCLLIILVIPVSAQMSIATMSINQVDYSGFPIVKVRSIIHDGNNMPVAASDLNNLSVIEDGIEVDFNVTNEDVGTEVLFVMDLGLSLGASGASGDSRFGEMRQILQNYAEILKDGDSMGLVTVSRGSHISFDRTLTSDTNEIIAAINQFENKNKSITTSQDGLAGISAAIKELKTSERKDDVQQAIIFVTPGLYTSLTLEAVLEEAELNQIPVHTILVNQTQANYMVPLDNLSISTQAIYTHFDGVNSLKPLWDWVSTLRSQAVFQFVSENQSSDERLVKIVGNSGLYAESSYQIDLAAPIVRISSPANNEQIVREAETPGTDMNTVLPTSMEIRAEVSWPDGIERQIDSIELLIDGSPFGDTQYQQDGNAFIFYWDLTANYKKNGTYNPILQVQVVDNLGLDAVSAPVNVKIDVIVPERTLNVNPADLDACNAYGGIRAVICRANAFAGWISLGIAAIALVLVVVFRTKLSGAAVQVGHAIGETIQRLTRPPQTQVGAYLTVLRGADDLPRNRFEIYANTVTPIGRDKRQAEIVFDEAADRSVVSRLHCEIRDERGIFSIRDLGSSQGTYVNSQRLSELGSVELKDGDTIEVGPIERGGILLQFELAKDDGYQSQPELYPEVAEADLINRETQIYPGNGDGIDDLADQQTQIYDGNDYPYQN